MDLGPARKCRKCESNVTKETECNGLVVNYSRTPGCNLICALELNFIMIGSGTMLAGCIVRVHESKGYDESDNNKDDTSTQDEPQGKNRLPINHYYSDRVLSKSCFTLATVFKVCMH